MIVAHPHYLYRFSNDTNLVTSRAASFWIFCNVTESCSEQPSHTTDAYSTIGSQGLVRPFTTGQVRPIAKLAPHIHKIVASIFCDTYSLRKGCSYLEVSKKTFC